MWPRRPIQLPSPSSNRPQLPSLTTSSHSYTLCLETMHGLTRAQCACARSAYLLYTHAYIFTSVLSVPSRFQARPCPRAVLNSFTGRVCVPISVWLSEWVCVWGWEWGGTLTKTKSSLPIQIGPQGFRVLSNGCLVTAASQRTGMTLKELNTLERRLFSNTNQSYGSGINKVRIEGGKVWRSLRFVKRTRSKAVVERERKRSTSHVVKKVI